MKFKDIFFKDDKEKMIKTVIGSALIIFVIVFVFTLLISHMNLDYDEVFSFWKFIGNTIGNFIVTYFLVILLYIGFTMLESK